MTKEDPIIIFNQIRYPEKFQNKNSKKEKLANKLEQKLSKKGKDFVEHYLYSKGELPFEGADEEYTNIQIYWGKEKISFEEFPQNLRNISKVLRNIGKTNPTRLSNINKDTKENQVYWFLKEMQEPSEKYFKDGNSHHSVVQYLTIKYSDFFKNINEENCLERSESSDIVLAMKEGAIQDLENSFTNRGPILGKTFPRDIQNEISKMITSKRYYYLRKLSKKFSKNPESERIIEFVNSLPNNTWFDDKLSLICDDSSEFENYNKKYDSNYKTVNETIQEIKNKENPESEEELPF